MDKGQKERTSKDSVSQKLYKKPVNKQKNTFQHKSIPALSGVTLICKLYGDCEFTYKFLNEDEYQYWDCELNDGTLGNYKILDTLLVLEEKRTVGNITLKEELHKLSFIYSGSFFVLYQKEVFEEVKWVTTYERKQRTRAYGKECQYYISESDTH